MFLKDKYYKDSFRYAQNIHSITAYLFLYNPDSLYMYKAKQAKKFADLIEFYDDWKTGIDMNITVYNIMCDAIVEEMKDNEKLLAINETRFDGRYGLTKADAYSDAKLHIFLFDIIYCCIQYELFEQIDYKEMNKKEKNERKRKQDEFEQALEKYEQACLEAEKLEEATRYCLEHFKKGTKIRHKKFGEGIIEEIDERYVLISLSRSEETKQLGTMVAIGNGIIGLANVQNDEEMPPDYLSILKKANVVKNTLQMCENRLENMKIYYRRK